MNSKGSKNKGSSFEREVSKLLDAWWKVPPGTFYRSKLSGGANEPGDITPRLMGNNSSLWWPFAVECKHHKDLKFLQLFESESYKDGPLILRWWWQLVRDITAKDFTKWRLLIFKGNNTPILVAFMPRDWFELHSPISFKPLEELRDLIIYRSASLTDVLYICTWKEFSSKITKDALMKIKEDDQ
jgi:hypothetical protein